MRQGFEAGVGLVKIITTKRIISSEELKYRNGFGRLGHAGRLARRRYSRPFALTKPAGDLAQKWAYSGGNRGRISRREWRIGPK
jgi:hypothetical protein